MTTNNADQPEQHPPAAGRPTPPPPPARVPPPPPSIPASLGIPGPPTTPPGTFASPFAPPAAGIALPPPAVPAPHPYGADDAVSPVAIGSGSDWQRLAVGSPFEPGGFDPRPPLPAGTHGPADAVATGGWTEINLGGMSPVAAARPGGRRRKVAALGAAAAVLAGGLATVRLVRPSPTGSPSPTAAVETMIHALEQRDLLGAVDTFPAYDRQLVAEAVSQYAANPMTSKQPMDFHAVSGYTLAVTDLATTTEQVTEDIALVTLSGGRYHASVDLAQAYRSAGLDGVAESMSSEVLPAVDGDLATLDDPIRLATVHDGEGWHVSLAYTFAELARRDEGLPAPDPARRIPAVGAESAESAARKMVDAVVAGDGRRAIELTPSAEAGVLHDYGQLVLDAHQMRPTGARVTAFESHTEQVRGHTVVVLDHIAVVSNDDTTDIRRDGSGCVKLVTAIGGDEQRFAGCVKDLTNFLAKSKVDGPTIAKLESQLLTAFDESGIVVAEHDGAWFVSPLRTIGSLAAPAAVVVAAWFLSEDGFGGWFGGSGDTSDTSASYDSGDSGDNGQVVDVGGTFGTDDTISIVPGDDGTATIGGTDGSRVAVGNPTVIGGGVPSTTLPFDGPYADRAAQAMTRAATAVLSAVWTDKGAAGAITEESLHEADPDLFPGARRGVPSTGPSDVSWNLVGPVGAETGVVVATRSTTGACFLLRMTQAGGLEYRRHNTTDTPCVAFGGDDSSAAWSPAASVGWAGSSN